VRPALLCAASGHGTVHLFRLEEHERCAACAAPDPVCPGYGLAACCRCGPCQVAHRSGVPCNFPAW